MYFLFCENIQQGNKFTITMQANKKEIIWFCCGLTDVKKEQKSLYTITSITVQHILLSFFGLFRFIYCLFWLNRNTETRCFGTEAKQPKQRFRFG
jgi:hypothetical protein